MDDRIKDFLPQTYNPLPWAVLERYGCAGIWHGVIDANGKRVCNCRNRKDAEFIVRRVNQN